MTYDIEKPPNKYTKAMGKLIRQAREEAGLSQEELAKKIDRKRLAVSKMENGKVAINVWILHELSCELEKPITYFYPRIWRPFDPDSDELDSFEKDLINNFRLIEYVEIKRISIDIIKGLASYNPRKHINKAFDDAEEHKLEREEYFKGFLERRKKRRII